MIVRPAVLACVLNLYAAALHPAAGQPPVQPAAARSVVTESAVVQSPLADQLLPVVQDYEGEVAVCVRHLQTGEQFLYRADIPQPTASLIKLAVMVTAYREADAGRLDLDKRITLTEQDKVPGSGILTNHFSAGTSFSVRDAIRLMIRYSDNTATNLVIDQIGLPKTSETMQELGFSNTRLHAKVFRGDTSLAPERSREFGLGSTTARETVDLLGQLHAETIARKSSCNAMTEHLLQCDDQTKIAARLPPGAKFAHKTGAVSASRTDAGILYGPKGPIAVCVLTTRNSDKSWQDDNAAHRLAAEIGRRVFDYFNPPSDRSSTPSDQPLQIGSSGDLVEMLQRTLNARLQPSPELSVDGDFGPATEAAVRRFQEGQSVPVTGVFDALSWKLLGPLVAAAEVPDPQVVNSEVLSLEPADSSDGPPVVTCKAWTIVDAADGETLWSYRADRRLDIASTTKIMTAWLVIQLADRQPSVLDEVLTMSERADRTPGSTSSLKAGEMLTIREALYGLMLPSGNDMSVALAEHFGHRLAAAPSTVDNPSTGNEPSTGNGQASAGRPEADSNRNAADAAVQDPLPLFVEAMNREAARLGMNSTRYSNPHGLTSPDHLSTASDLAVLATKALSSQLFQQYVQTVQRGVTVQGANGYLRNVRWVNTNQLLKISGYSGVKTGTTDKAGACLVSTSERNGRRLLLVVLGSAASESRYADSRNLYRWAWQQLD